VGRIDISTKTPTNSMIVTGSVLRNRGSVYVKFNTADDGCVWNLKIEWADPGYPDVLWKDVDLCKISTLRLRYNRGTDTTSYLAE
jgi:hypothetical protein